MRTCHVSPRAFVCGAELCAGVTELAGAQNKPGRVGLSHMYLLCVPMQQTCVQLWRHTISPYCPSLSVMFSQCVSKCLAPAPPCVYTCECVPCEIALVLWGALAHSLGTVGISLRSFWWVG